MENIAQPVGNLPVQRRSCDFCHKQKLRCTREKNHLGGVCDRCHRRRAPCVYSNCLPRGRPGLQTQMQSSSSSSSSFPQSAQNQDQNQNQNQVSAEYGSFSGPENTAFSTSENETLIITALSNSSGSQMTDVSTGTGGNVAWTDFQLGIDWDSEEINNGLCAGLDPEFPTQPLGNSSQLLSQILPTSPIHTNMRSVLIPPPHGDHMAKYSGTVCEVIGHLSQLVVRLSELRYSGHALQKATEACMYAQQHAPLLDAATYESLAGWLTSGPGNSLEGLTSSTSNDDAPILHQAFSNSHRLLEILRILEPFYAITTSSMATTGSQILKHLLLASEVLLLEIYQVILIATQCDATASASKSSAAVEDVRLVFAVQLCSYYIRRQQHGIDACLGASRPGSIIDLSSQDSLPFNANSLTPLSQAAEQDIINHLKLQVQARVQHLRTVLQCA